MIYPEANDIVRDAKILIDSHQGIGDLAMMLPSIKAVANIVGENNVFVITKSEVEALLVEAIGIHTEHFHYDPLDHSIPKIASLVINLRRIDFDLGISHIGINPRLAAMLLKAAGCDNTAGASRPGLWPGFSIPISLSNDLPRSDMNYELMCKLGVTERPMGPELFTDLQPTQLTASILKFAQNSLGLVGLCVGSGCTTFKRKGRKVSVNAKQWGFENWLDLASKLDSLGYAVILFGGGKERREMGAIVEEVDLEDRFYDAVGKFSLAQSLEALSLCSILIGADTGLLFCAADMEIPSLSLLGPSDPMRSLPSGELARAIYLGLECSPCYGELRMMECTDRKCMSSIYVDNVLAEALTLMGSRR